MTKANKDREKEEDEDPKVKARRVRKEKRRLKRKAEKDDIRQTAVKEAPKSLKQRNPSAPSFPLVLSSLTPLLWSPFFLPAVILSGTNRESTSATRKYLVSPLEKCNQKANHGNTNNSFIDFLSFPYSPKHLNHENHAKGHGFEGKFLYFGGGG